MKKRAPNSVTTASPVRSVRPGRNASASASNPAAGTSKNPAPPRHFAVVGAGMAGIACARTLIQAGHQVTVFDEGTGTGGRMSAERTPFGTFDSGAQYFTVRDPRFSLALQTAPGVCRPWSANTVRVLDPLGRVAAAALPPREPHWVALPGMDALVEHWAAPLKTAQTLQLCTQVTHIARDALNPRKWQLHTQGTNGAAGAQHVYSDFDAVLLAVPKAAAEQLLQPTPVASRVNTALARVQVAPCWTLMLAFPHAVQPGVTTLGPHWNAARSTHHRIAWLARESSKPGRGGIERWTVQASAAWSQEHLTDDADRIRGKLCKAFSEVTGIRTQPAHAEVRLWRQAQTVTPLQAGGATYLWDAKTSLGVCGDWCIGHRVEDAFVSGLELALAVA